jgi:acetyl-CoA synthetase
MTMTITAEPLKNLGLDAPSANKLADAFNALAQTSAEKTWQMLSSQVLSSAYPFDVHLFFFNLLFPHWREHPETAPAYLPSSEGIASANITTFMSALGMHDVKTFHDWSTKHYPDFWQAIVAKLPILFSKAPEQFCDLSEGLASPRWFKGATLNIVESCFSASPSSTAIIYQQQNRIQRMTYGELNALSNRIANSLVEQGYTSGDAIGIAMPMSPYAIAIYLGIIKMGGIVVSIADSFSGQEIAVRLNIAKAKAIFTQDFSIWAGKKNPLYEKVQQGLATLSQPLTIIVLPCQEESPFELRQGDKAWRDFLTDNEHFHPKACDPMTPCNILFSSGTTGEPKAIVWNHTTPIKAASDAYFHQNIQQDDVLAWPTNLGWMMGPWLIFATLINRAAMALYSEAPKDRAFGEFIQQAGVTMLGVVPTLVAVWRQTQCMAQLNWQRIKVFSSTGECSNAEDMLYLMSLAGYKPVIEYCGGTEIGGAYLSSTVIENNYPSLFSTPTMGLDIAILDEEGRPASSGEVAIVPPSLGLSTQLLNADHQHVYFDNMPLTPDGKILRRHGDQIKQLSNGYYCVLGRVDDTMKLGGIKTSAAEIERLLAGLPHIIELAAIAISPRDRGPSQLIIFTATSAELDKTMVMKEMQKRINQHLNPLFKIHEVVFTKELPKTASNKIMRRLLRKQYEEAQG